MFFPFLILNTVYSILDTFMHHRSFFVGWGTTVLALGIGVLGILLVANAQMTSESLADLSSFEASLQQASLDAAAPASEELPPIVFATSTVALYQPPLRYLRAVKGDPRLTPADISVRVPILMYHHIRAMKSSFTAKDRQYTVTPEHFEAQMERLVKAGYTTITPRELEAAIEGKMILPEKAVLLTFDDGYREHYKIAFPILRRLHLKATYFIISSTTRIHAHMTEEMIREVDASGLVTIADHTRHHPFLARMSSASRVPEIVDSKQDLEAIIGHPVLDFAYPFGSWSQEVANDVRKAGYTLGFGIRLGSLHGESSRYQLRRIRVLDGEDVVPMLDLLSKP